jgi:hypothetical protein
MIHILNSNHNLVTQYKKENYRAKLNSNLYQDVV